jgi:hypothetical protein
MENFNKKKNLEIDPNQTTYSFQKKDYDVFVQTETLNDVDSNLDGNRKSLFEQLEENAKREQADFEEMFKRSKKKNFIK